MATINPSILVVEDEPHIRRLVGKALQDESYLVIEANKIQQASDCLKNKTIDLLVLDLGLPDGDGLTLIQQLRLWSKLPILVLSARTQEQDKIKALDAGADDYLAKPFAMGELLARVRALLRRSHAHTNKPTQFEFGEVIVDLQKMKITRHNESIHLTPTEFQLLSVFLLNSDRVLTQRYLLRELWGSTFVENSHYLRIYVRHLRQKLEKDPSQPCHFITETGIGYRFQW
jgi:two-component system KDP operon response regulator KdpE